MYTLILGGWIVGMAGYVYFSYKNKYNNKHYYNVKRQVKKFKNIRDDLNGVKKTTFK
jgi:hypothetical protein